MIGGGSDHQCPAGRKCAAVVQFASRGKLYAVPHLSFLQQEKPAVRRNCRHVSALVCGNAVGIIDLTEGIHSLEAVIHSQYLHAAGGPDIIVSVRSARDAAHGIGGQTVGLVEYVYYLLTYHDGQTVVVRSYPQTALLIDIQAVDVLDGLVVVYPAELTPVIPVETRISTYPEYAVIGLRDVVRLTAGKSVVAAVDTLDIIVVIGDIGYISGIRADRRRA